MDRNEVFLGLKNRILWDNSEQTRKQRDKIKKFTYSSCSIINNDINTHENNSCLVVKLVDTKDLKSTLLGVPVRVCRGTNNEQNNI